MLPEDFRGPPPESGWEGALEALPEELRGEIMLKAAQQTLERAAALKKQQHPQLKQIAVRHQMLQANDTNATNATDSTEGEESANAGAFDLTAWLDSQPDPSTWTDPLPTPFDLKKYLKCQPTFDLSAWLKDSSEKLKPGCPTTRLTNCADTDFEDDNTHKCCLVEVKHEDEWGVVCDDSSQEALLAAAKVACRSVGCKGAIKGVYSFGAEASAPIWMDNTECVGTENGLEDCERSAWGDHNCDESEAMGVCCTQGCEGWGGIE